MTLAEFLEEVSAKHPNFEALSNLLAHLSFDDISPDALIDLAHSLNEGTAKNLRFLVDKGTAAHVIEGQVNTAKHWNTLRQRLSCDALPPEFLQSLHGLFEDVRTMRNRHGDITHGHIGPKYYSDPKVARFLLDLSLAHSRYALACAQEIEPDQIPYDRYPNFNDFLDETGEAIGRALYSQLIYSHDYERYLAELEQYNPDIYADQ